MRMRFSSGTALIFFLLLFGIAVTAADRNERDFNRGNSINLPPIVTLTAPEAGATYVEPARIELKARASDPDGRLQWVRFYANGGLIAVRRGGSGRDGSEQEYRARWRNVPAGTYVITAEAEDRHGVRTLSAAHTITVQAAGVPANRPPSATPASVSTPEDTPAGIVLTGTDPDGDTLTFSIVSQPAHGTLSGTAPTLTYTPAPNYFGADSFAFSVSDGTLISAPATVLIEVTAVNDVPVAANDAHSTNEDVTLTVAAPGVLGNDTDVETSVLSAALVTGPSSGTLTLNADGSFSYTPNANFSGADSFTYKANDGSADSNVATVSIKIDAVNDAPVAVNDSYTTDEDLALTIAARGVLANDTDNDSTTLTAALVAGPTNGSLTLNADGSFSYTPNANFSGADSFTYKANDGSADSNVATVSITINAVNDAPVAVNDSYTTDEDVALTIAARGVLGNDTDNDSTTLTAVLVAGTTKGTLTLNADGSFNYTPNENFNGSDTFTYTANDGTVNSTQATVTISVTAVNDAPTVTLAAPGGPFTAPATIKLVATVSDPDGTSATVRFIEGGEGGSQSLLGTDNTAPYELTLENQPEGQRNIRAEVTDDGGATASSTVLTITIAPRVNVPPTVTLTSPAEGASFVAPATILLSADADDSDGTITGVTFLVGGGALEVLTGVRGAGNAFTATFSTAAPGTFTVRATATDSDGAQAQSTRVTITVRSATDPLIQQTNLQYEGAFLLPEFDPMKADILTFAFGGTALAFNPLGGSLFIVGNDQSQLVAELTIPAINNPVPANLSALNRATLAQPLTDALEGKLDLINESDTSKKIGGLLPYGTSLYVSGYDYYDGVGSQVLSHFITSTDLRVPNDVDGPFQVGEPGLGAGFVSGYFGLVPSQWQEALGGPVLNGNCCLGVASRSSFGPAVFAIDPVHIGVGAFAPAQPLVYYPEAQPLAPHASTGPLFNGTSEVKGVVFPEGWRSVLFFGRHGLGEYCYGEGTTDRALDGTAHPNGVDVYCYDPADDTKGVHAFPYAYYVWAYDALDLAAVKNGTKQPWQVQPYGLWELDLPYRNETGRLGGATYDPTSGRIYISQMYGDTAHPNNPQPVIHVFKLQ